MFHARILRYLDEVVRAGSLRKAAANLGIASSSISRQIADVEEELGTPIFDRLPGKMRLTAAGELLVSHVRQTLKAHDQIVGRIANLTNPGRGTVTVGTMNGPAGGFVPQLALAFTARYPDVKIVVRSQVAATLVKAVAAAEVDLGIGYNLPADPAVRTVLSLEVRLGVIVSPQHPLATREAVRLADCTGFPAVIPGASMTSHAQIVDACEKSRVRLAVAMATNSIDLMKRTVEDGNSLAFLSRPDVATEVAADRLRYLPIRDAALSSHRFSLIRRENAVLDQTGSLFLEAAQAAMRAVE